MPAILKCMFLAILFIKHSTAYNNTFPRQQAIIYLDDVPIQVNTLNLKPTVRAGTAVARDAQNERNFVLNGGEVDYGSPPSSPLSNHRATGIKATITKSLIEARIGKCAYSNIKPPGFAHLQNAGACAQRGHLLAQMLGGSGLDVRNIVTVTAMANNPGMTKWERMVRDVWSQRLVGPRCHVEYEVLPLYGFRPYPSSINIQATIVDRNNPFLRILWFRVRISNEPVPAAGDVNVRDLAAFRRENPKTLDC